MRWRAAATPTEVVDAVRRHNDALGIPRTSGSTTWSTPATSWPASWWRLRSCGPTSKLADVEPANVRKRMKDKAFARAVPREMLLAGAEELGLEFDEHVAQHGPLPHGGRAGGRPVGDRFAIVPSPPGSATGASGS